MSDTISGYIDRSYVKGQTYKYAGCPIPTVFTGDIDTISDSLLGKAILVVNNGTNGTFPSETIGPYLITTIEYGNSTILQSCVDKETNIEFKRIYQSSWSVWSSPNSDVATIKTQINGTNGIIERLDSDETNIQYLTDEIYGTSSITGLKNDISNVRSTLSNHESRISALENGSLKPQVSTNILDCIANNSYSRATVTSCYFTKVGAMCSLTLGIKTKATVTSGSNILSVGPGTLTDRYWPPYVAYGSGYYGDNSVPISLSISNNNKTIIVRNAGDDSIASGANMNTNVMWTYSISDESEG